ncbi:MAG TPA: hypothetical protein VNM72_13290 [Blastocatellia bacterium]|nr:hypothetical protein [Blastocatellia bacterium]
MRQAGGKEGDFKVPDEREIEKPAAGVSQIALREFDRDCGGLQPKHDAATTGRVAAGDPPPNLWLTSASPSWPCAPFTEDEPSLLTSDAPNCALMESVQRQRFRVKSCGLDLQTTRLIPGDSLSVTNTIKERSEFLNMRSTLGDSLSAMNLLPIKEGTAGEAKMIDANPRCDIKHSSNCQSRIDCRDVKDNDEDLTYAPRLSPVSRIFSPAVPRTNGLVKSLLACSLRKRLLRLANRRGKLWWV